MAENSTYLNKSLDRALRLLDLFSQENSSFTACELALALGTTRVTLYPTLNVFLAHGYLERDNQGRFALGMKLVERGGAKLALLDVRRVAQPRLRHLAAELGANAHLATLHGDEVLYLEREEGRPSVSLREIVGVRVSPHCTALGKALLAFIPEEITVEIVKRLSYVSHTSNTITTSDAFLKELQAVRLAGYAVELEEFHVGSACVAAPVFRSDERAIAAISVSLSRRDLEMGGVISLARAVTEAAHGISTDLGCSSDCLLRTH